MNMSISYYNRYYNRYQWNDGIIVDLFIVNNELHDLSRIIFVSLSTSKLD